MRRFIPNCSFLIAYITGITLAYGQCPDPNVSVDSEACINGYLQITNTSPSTTFLWDFCADELSQKPVAQPILNSREFGRARGFDLFEDRGQKYMASISNSTYNITILGFGDSYTNTPVFIAQTHVSSLTFSPFDVDVVISNDSRSLFFIATNESTLFRADYGDSWFNTPTISSLPLTFSSAPNSVEIVSDGADFYGFVSLQNSIVKLGFGTNILNPSPSVSEVSVPGANVLRNIDFTEECSEFVGLVSSYQTREIYRITFDNDSPSGVMQVNPLVNNGDAFNFPAGLSMAKEGDSTHVFFQSATGQLIHASFDGLPGLDFAPTDYGLLGGSNQSFPLALVKEGAYYYAFSADHRNRNLVRFTFPSSCDGDQELSSIREPVKSYGSSGRKVISLTSKNGETISRQSFEVDITAGEAPAVGFTADVACSMDPVQFQFTEDPTDLTITWDFGDGSSGSGASVSHSYAVTGSYQVEVLAVALNGCTNAIENIIEVRDDVVAAYSTNGGLTCTNQLVLFNNETANAIDGSTTYRWYVDGAQVSTEENLFYEFPAPGNYTVRLESQDQLCLSSFEQVFNVLEGAVPDFETSDVCDGNTVIFSNLSTGDISGFTWDFGDGNGSTEISPEHDYAGPGTYTVLLTAISDNGCETVAEQLVTVNARPIADFSQELPCTGLPVQFTDLSSVENANIISWNWDFGSAGTSNQQNPDVFFDAPGDYTITLEVTSDLGCTSMVQKTIRILESPTAAFAYQAACAGDPVQFTDLSEPAAGNSIIEYAWSIDGSFSNEKDPLFTFDAPGDYLVSLTVTGSDQCTSSITQTVEVPEIPLMEFDTSSECVPLEIVFTDLTTSTDDRVASRNWDFAGLGNSQDSVTNFMFPTAGNYNILLVVNTESGCSYSITRNIVVEDIPEASFTPSTSAGPPPLSVRFENTTTGNYDYTWLINMNPVSTEEDLTYTFTEEGVYSVTLQAGNALGCVSNYTESITVGDPVMDIAAISLLGQGTGTRLELQNFGNIPVGQVPVIIQTAEGIATRLLSVDLRPNETQFVLIPEGLNEFICVEIGDVIEGYPDEDLSNNSTCLTENGGSVAGMVYPNPATNLVYLQVFTGSEDEIRASWIDASGRQINTPGYTISRPGSGIISFDVSLMARGMYFLVVRTSSGQQIYRVAIQ